MDTVDVLNWTAEAASSRMLRLVPPELLQSAAQTGMALNAHSFGVGKAVFESSTLSKAFNVLSTSIDSNGKEYISTMEHKTLPFFAVQWHPEKAPFEWSHTLPDSVHTMQAIQLSQAIANGFVQVRIPMLLFRLIYQLGHPEICFIIITTIIKYYCYYCSCYYCYVHV